MAHPSAERVVRILDFLGTHPGRGFILTELAQRLSISRSTALAVLTTLADHGLVVRNPTTLEYRLGPALIPLGTVAERAMPAVTHARREAEQLAADLDAECVVVAEAGADLLIVGHAGTPGPASFSHLDAERFPFAPPIGTLMVAWAGSDAIESWLDRAGDGLDEADREHYRAVLRAIRGRGYAVSLQIPRLVDLLAVHAHRDTTAEGRTRLADAQLALAREGRYLLGDGGPPADAAVSTITAAVFAADQSVLLTIGLLPGDRPAPREIPRLARPVVRAAQRVTAAIHGRRPDPGG